MKMNKRLKISHSICEICSAYCDKCTVLKISRNGRPCSDDQVFICNECLINLINHMNMERSRHLNIDPMSFDKRYFGHTLPHHARIR